MRAWRDRSEHGYASLSVAGLMAGLSLLAIGYSNLSISKARLLAAETKIIEKDIAIEGLFFQTAARLASRDLSVDNRWQARTYGDDTFQIRLSFENTKTDVNRASTGALTERLEGIMAASEASRLAARLSAQTSNSKTLFPNTASLKDRLQGKISYACFRDNVTIYRSPATLSRKQTGSRAFAEDGAIVRIEITTLNDTVPRALDAVILLTGQQNDPIWVLDWQRQTDIDTQGCPDA